MILLKLQGFNAFFATDLFPYPLKTSENQMVPDSFGGGAREKDPWYEMGLIRHLSY